MAIKDVTPLEITTAKLVLTMSATLIPESKSNFSKRVNGLEVTFFYNTKQKYLHVLQLHFTYTTQ